jgi:hypothetical protein
VPGEQPPEREEADDIDRAGRRAQEGRPHPGASKAANSLSGKARTGGHTVWREALGH